MLSELVQIGPFVSMAVVLGALGAYVVSRYAVCLNLVDEPCERSSHVRPTPKGGGIGILVAFLFVALALELATWLWLPPALLAVVSLLGDRRELKPRLRLAIQFTAALAVLLGAYANGTLHVLPANGLGVLPLTLGLMIFIVGTANFYNFMDGINGLAGLSGVVAFAALGALAWRSGDQSYSVLDFSIVLACIGFLPFNLPRARVFMGDVGSILLGFTFACQVVLLASNLSEFLVMAALLLPFYLDELTTMYVRLCLGERLSAPHRRHLYQILVNEFKWPHWLVATLYAVVQAVIASLFIALWGLAWYIILSVYLIMFVVFVLLTFSIRARVPVAP